MALFSSVCPRGKNTSALCIIILLVTQQKHKLTLCFWVNVCVRVFLCVQTSQSHCFDSSRWQEETLRVNTSYTPKNFHSHPEIKEKKGKTTHLGFWFSFCLALHKSISAMTFRGKVVSQKRKIQHCLFRSVSELLVMIWQGSDDTSCFIWKFSTLALCWFPPSFVPLSYNYLEVYAVFNAFILVKVLCAAASATSWLFLPLLWFFTRQRAPMLYEFQLIMETICWGNAAKSLPRWSAMSRINTRICTRKKNERVKLTSHQSFKRSKTRHVMAVKKG